jgi:hypothetical protein
MKYRGTAIGCTVMLLLTLPEHCGYFLGLFVVVLVPVFAYRAVRIGPSKSQWSEFGVRLGMWTLAIAIAVAVNYYRDVHTREFANEVVARLAKYHETHGAYPASLESLGYETTPLRDNLRYHGYSNRPTLFYAVPYVVFDKYRYDFSVGRWDYLAD